MTVARAATLLGAVLLGGSGLARASDAGPARAAAASATQLPVPGDDPYELDPAEPDFTVIDLPTTLRLPRHAWGFWLTHRFARPLGRGDFGDLLADFFGFDGGAQIGLGLRFGLFADTRLQVYRTSDRTIELDAQVGLVREDGAPLGLALVGSVEGLDNFSEQHSPRLGIVLSKRLGSRAALYAVPQWVGNTRRDFEVGNDDWTLLLGLGARVGLGERAALVAEWHPRLAGFAGVRAGEAARDLVSFGVEMRVGGHSFQLNFSNDLATTPGQVARGQQGPDDWFIGFNLTRKFF